MKAARGLTGVLAVLLVLGAGLLIKGAASRTADAAAAEASHANVTISKETTFITEPLTKDGYVDYVAALNKAAKEGVTVENNAVVLFCQAMGPSVIGKKMRGQFFEMLGIDPLPEDGEYFVRFREFAKSREEQRELAGGGDDAKALRKKLSEEYDQSRKRPWSKAEFPEMAQWLELNEEPLRLIVEGTRRPRYYTPMISQGDENGPGLIITVLLPILVETREFARLLHARAMLHLNNGEVEAAWRDLLACHRLARLAGQDPTLIGALVGIAIDGIACSADAQLIDFGNPSTEQARRMLADLQALPTLAPMTEKLNTTERYAFLDAVCSFARGQTTVFDLAGGRPEPMVAGMLEWAGSMLVDWDLVLRKGNSWYDRLIEAIKKPTHAERRAALNVLDREIRAIARKTRDPLKLAGSFFQWQSPQSTVSGHVGNVMMALLIPLVTPARKAEDRGTTRGRLTEIAFALAAYRADYGDYPHVLAVLVPKYLRQVPQDLFTDEGFRYKRDGAGYLIYSLGPNMKDNGGKVEHLDRDKAKPKASERTSDWDDFRLRMPPESD